MTSQKKIVCPICGKRGVTQWHTGLHSEFRHCRYCRAQWSTTSWALLDRACCNLTFNEAHQRCAAERNYQAAHYVRRAQSDVRS